MLQTVEHMKGMECVLVWFEASASVWTCSVPACGT